MSNFLSDLHQAFRSMKKNAGTTTLALLMLALGIGATTAIFSVFHAVLLQPLPFSEPERIVEISETRIQRNIQSSFTEANFWDLRTRNRTFEEIACLHGDDANLTGLGDPEHVSVARISAGFFRTLGVKPILGRDFFPEEDRPGNNNNVVLLRHRFWKTRFAADPKLVGETLRLDGRPFSVIGVLPPGEPLLDAGDIFIPQVYRADADRSSWEYSVIGRLKPGVSIETARADLDIVAKSLAADFPGPAAGLGFALEPASSWVASDDLRRALWVLLAAVGFLLLIACINLANLLLARATARAREIAIRSALGAGRFQIARLALTESLVLGLFGGGFGLLLALWIMDIFKSNDPGNIPRLANVGLNPWVLGFTLFIALLTSILSGLLPALRAPFRSLSIALREGDRSQTGSRSQSRLRSALVTVEVALCLILLIGAGLLIRSFSHLLNVNRGFQVENRMTFSVNVPSTYNRERINDFRSRFLSRLGSIPGVVSVSAVNSLPIVGWNPGMGFAPADRPIPDADVPWAGWRIITPEYFKTMGIPLLKGRLFNEGDAIGKPWRVIISQRLADRLWPNEDPVGRHAILWKGQGQLDAEVIGVVSNIRERGLDRNVTFTVYLPATGAGFSSIQFVMHTSNNPTSAMSSVRPILSEIDSDLPISNVRSLDLIIDRSLAARRFNVLLLSVFASVALLLAMAGIYGVLAYSIARRTSEIGVRVALGATPRRILRLVVGQGMIPILIGVVFGLGGAFGLSRYLTSLLYEVKPADPLTYVAVAAVVIATALASCYLPALRAIRIDPATALREE